MNESTLWGVILIVSVLPYGVWYFSHLESIEIRKKLYPGSEAVRATDNRATIIGLAWSFAFAVLLLFWAIGLKPIASAIVAALVFAAGAAGAMLICSKIHLRSRKARALAAGTILWAFLVLAWYAIFGRRSDIAILELLAVVVLPPVLLFAGFALRGWVGKGAP